MSRTHIRARRMALGLPQSEVARLANVPETDLRKWERGLSLPDPSAAKRLADILTLEVPDLLEAQIVHARTAIPGEGYTTSEAGGGKVYQRHQEVPSGRRRVLDIFCGSGGLSYGFEQTGEFVTTFGIDLLSDRVETFVSNHRHATGFAGDIRKISLSDVHSLAGSVNVVVGGPPCQGFSSIRPFRNLTEGDPRNSLGEHYVLALHQLQPDWFVFENVVGIVTHEGGGRLYALLEGLRGAGYAVDWRVLNAALFGVPQNRERVVIVGNRLGVQFIWPEPTHHLDHKSMAGNRPQVVRTAPIFSVGLEDAVPLMDAIDDLPEVASGEEALNYDKPPRTPYQAMLRSGASSLTLHKSTKHSAKMLEIIRHSGANISALPKGMVSSGFSSCYSRLDPDKPSTTLTVNFVHPASNRCIHPYQHRALTPREGARIQSFPDTFEFRGTSAQVVKQIGNAVPPLLGQRIAESIVKSEAAAKPLKRIKNA